MEDDDSRFGLDKGEEDEEDEEEKRRREFIEENPPKKFKALFQTAAQVHFRRRRVSRGAPPPPFTHMQQLKIRCNTTNLTYVMCTWVTTLLEMIQND